MYFRLGHEDNGVDDIANDDRMSDWSQPKAGFTGLFEAYVRQLMKEMLKSTFPLSLVK